MEILVGVSVSTIGIGGKMSEFEIESQAVIREKEV
jgi:hypothetical protein